MGGVALLQDHHGVPDVPVTEVQPNLCPRRRPATKPFDWEEPRSRLIRKRQSIGSGLVPPRLPCLPLLSLIPIPLYPLCACFGGASPVTPGNNAEDMVT